MIANGACRKLIDSGRRRGQICVAIHRESTSVQGNEWKGEETENHANGVDQQARRKVINSWGRATWQM